MRAELLLMGLDPGKLGSPRDITLRGILTKTKIRDSHKLMAHMAASLGNTEELKKQYGLFSHANLYKDYKETRDHKMLEYYNKYVKHLRPELFRDADGKASVRGLTNAI